MLWNRRQYGGQVACSLFKGAIVNTCNHVTTDEGKLVGGQLGIPILILSLHLDGSETALHL